MGFVRVYKFMFAVLMVALGGRAEAGEVAENSLDLLGVHVLGPFCASLSANDSIYLCSITQVESSPATNTVNMRVVAKVSDTIAGESQSSVSFSLSIPDVSKPLVKPSIWNQFVMTDGKEMIYFIRWESRDGANAPVVASVFPLDVKWLPSVRATVKINDIKDKQRAEIAYLEGLKSGDPLVRYYCLTCIADHPAKEDQANAVSHILLLFTKPQPVPLDGIERDQAYLALDSIFGKASGSIDENLLIRHAVDATCDLKDKSRLILLTYLVRKMPKDSNRSAFGISVNHLPNASQCLGSDGVAKLKQVIAEEIRDDPTLNANLIPLSRWLDS